MYEEIFVRQQKITDYANRARYYKLPELPKRQAELIRGDKAVVLCGNLLQAYVFERNLWRKKAESDLGEVRKVSCTPEQISIETACGFERITIGEDKSEGELYFIRDIHYNNAGEQRLQLLQQQLRQLLQHNIHFIMAIFLKFWMRFA